jgi:hypothetical protein
MKKLIIIGTITFIFINSIVNAQWVQTTGAVGSTIRGIVVSSAGIFAGYSARYDSAGVIHSTDYGDS